MAFIDREHLPGVYHIEDCLGVCFTLLVGSKRALLVDAGYGLEDVAAHVRTLTDLPVTLWLTHGHYDHMLGARWFDAPKLLAADAPQYRAHGGERWRRSALAAAHTRGIGADRAEYLAFALPEPVLSEPEAVDLGGMTARIIPCPGHTPGSMTVHVPERGLLLTGDDWNPTTWAFFPESLAARAFRSSVRRLLPLGFDRVLCPHQPGLYRRETFEAFLDGLTDAALEIAGPSEAGVPYHINTHEVRLPEDMVFVFDADRLQEGQS